MSYSIEYSTLAIKQLKKLSKTLQENIIMSLERIRIRPYEFVQKIVGTETYRLRIKNYRVILDIINDKLVILVIKVGHRRNIYRK